MNSSWKPNQAILHRYERFYNNKKTFKKKGEKLKEIDHTFNSSLSSTSLHKAYSK
jgi:hypothetical protein